MTKRGQPAEKSTYRKKQERGLVPFQYGSTPLHREGQGVPVTPDNVRKFEERLGVKRVVSRDTRPRRHHRNSGRAA